MKLQKIDNICKSDGAHGITLIALIITIIVMLILAGATINMVVGDNGIISRTEEARIKQELATAKDLQVTSLVYNMSGLNVGKINESKTAEAIYKNFTANGFTFYDSKFKSKIENYSELVSTDNETENQFVSIFVEGKYAKYDGKIDNNGINVEMEEYIETIKKIRKLISGKTLEEANTEFVDENGEITTSVFKRLRIFGDIYINDLTKFLELGDGRVKYKIEYKGEYFWLIISKDQQDGKAKITDDCIQPYLGLQNNDFTLELVDGNSNNVYITGLTPDSNAIDTNGILNIPPVVTARNLDTGSENDEFNVIGISAYAFKKNNDIKKAVFDENFQEGFVFSEWCFYGCKQLEEIVFPIEKYKLNASAFSSCDKLTEIDIQNCEFIDDGYQVFDYCINLEKVKLPTNQVIPRKMFLSCSKLQKIEIPNTDATLFDEFGEGIFEYSGITDIYFPEIAYDPYEGVYPSWIGKDGVNLHWGEALPIE